MNYKQMPIYLGSFLKEGSKNIQNKDSTSGHEFGKLDEKTIIWPKNNCGANSIVK